MCSFRHGFNRLLHFWILLHRNLLRVFVTEGGDIHFLAQLIADPIVVARPIRFIEGDALLHQVVVHVFDDLFFWHPIFREFGVVSREVVR